MAQSNEEIQKRIDEIEMRLADIFAIEYQYEEQQRNNKPA